MARLIRRQPDDTQRFTIAWVLALAAVGVLALASTRLVVSTLELQSHAIDLMGDVDTAGAAAAQVASQAQSLVSSVEVDVGSLVGLAEATESLRDAHEAIRRMPGTGGAGLDEAFDALVASAEDLITHTRNDRGIGPPDSRDLELAGAVAAGAQTYSSALEGMQASGFDDSSTEIRDTVRFQKWVLAATIALLLLEAFLVFRPATRRIQETLEFRRRQAEDERERSQKQLEVLARYDHLTGLANRMMFRDRLEHAVNSASRSGKLVGLMFIDLDKFKDVNDQLGHDAGDDLLVQVAERLQDIARRTDTIARIGGDEFTVILENLESTDGAATVAQKILESLAEPIAVADREVHITASIGIAIYPDDGINTEDLLRNADTAMYWAKASGKNTFEFSTPELREENLARLQMIQDLRTAVAEKQLHLVYQPQISLQTGEIVAVEALVRWVRPDGTEVLAAEFIDVAEDTDLMVPLGEWVVREACRQGAQWESEGLPPLRIAVNFSARQFSQPNLATRIASTLGETGLDPHRFELEVTEASLVADTESSSVTLRLLKGLGVRVAIDDFGTGYSSLNYLRQFPIDSLKIDQSFLTTVTEAADEEAVVPTAIAGLARHLGMEATAEGVETEAQLEFLQRIGVDRAQGYFVSPPVLPDEIGPLVRRRRISSVAPLPASRDDAG